MPPIKTLPPARRILALAALAWVAYVAARTAIQRLLPVSDMGSYLEQDAVITILRLSCLAFCFWLGRLRYSRESFLNLPGRRALSWGLGAWFFAAFILSAVARPYAPLTPWNWGSRALETAIALAVAANEEVGWRGALFEPIRELWGAGWALSLTSLGFFLMHLGYQPWPAWPRIILTGLAFGLARLRGVSLTALIFIHFACDAAEALYQPEGMAPDMKLHWISAGLTGAAALAIFFLKPKPAAA